MLTTTLLAASGNPAAIYGTAARIEIDGWFYTPTAFRVIARYGTELERFEEPYEGRGLVDRVGVKGRGRTEYLKPDDLAVLPIEHGDRADSRRRRLRR